MLFFPSGGKLKITCTPLENAVPHHAVKAEKTVREPLRKSFPVQ